MTIFYFNEQDKLSAERLANAAKQQALQWQPALTRFGKTEDISFLGGNLGESNGKTPQEMADIIGNIYSDLKKSKERHVYLLASQANRLAQTLAQELSNRGFTNLIIHAIPAPSQLAGETMQVYVTEKGHVEASLLRNQQQPLVFYSHLESDYKKTMAQDFYTYSTTGLKKELSATVALAISYLANQEMTHHKDRNRAKHIKDGIHLLLRNPHYSKDDIRTALIGSRKDPKVSTFCTELIPALMAFLETVIQPQVPMPNSTAAILAGLPGVTTHAVDEAIDEANINSSDGDNAANVGPLRVRQAASAQPRSMPGDEQQMQQHPVSQDTQQNEKDAINGRLDTYINKRNEEWWGWSFHFDILLVKSAIYFITDWLFGTNYFNARKRETKVDAAEKLMNRVNAEETEDFTDSELDAMQEGRLGEIVSLYGGIDDLCERYPLLTSEAAPSPFM